MEGDRIAYRSRQRLPGARDVHRRRGSVFSQKENREKKLINYILTGSVRRNPCWWPPIRTRSAHTALDLMTDTEFDPYQTWLGIPPGQRPLDHYVLLGLPPFASDAARIAQAADDRMALVRRYQTGPRAAHTQKLLNELASAKLCLLSPPAKATYDAVLRDSQRLAGVASHHHNPLAPPTPYGAPAAPYGVAPAPYPTAPAPYVGPYAGPYVAPQLPPAAAPLPASAPASPAPSTSPPLVMRPRAATRSGAGDRSATGATKTASTSQPLSSTGAAPLTDADENSQPATFWQQHGRFAVIIAGLILLCGTLLAGWRWHILSVERERIAQVEAERLAEEEAERLAREEEEAAAQAAANASARALLVQPDLNGEFHLLPETVQLQSKQLSIGVQGKERVIDGWSTSDDEATWELQVAKADLFQIHVSYSTDVPGACGRVYVRVGEEEKSVDLLGTGDPTMFRSDRLFLAIKKRGKRTLRLRIEPPAKPDNASDKPQAIHLQAVKLVPYGLGKK